jgi:phosphomannomutase
MDAALSARVAAWLAADPDPETRAELNGLVAADDTPAVAARFAAPLRFGTAGLRGQLGAGPARMNRVVVRQAAQGLLDWLRGQGCAAPVVVIGYDARKNSDVFAADTAALVRAAGGRALLFDRPVPTPVLAYAVREYATDAGIMVTASHNPPADNGYKVYLGDGAQLVPPADSEIEAAIDAVGLPPVDLAGPAPGAELVVLGDDAVARYTAAVAAALAPQAAAPVPPVRVVYTPMHGVGLATLRLVFAAAGVAEPLVVAEQAAPDGTFPTVAFPNPEEPGAMDLALALARAEGADLLLANDPDADRLAVAVPDPDAAGGWRALTGNEIGILLADRALLTTSGADRLVVNSVVSSVQLGRLAAGRGVHHKETLTGFKWIGRVGYEDPALRYVFGFEEAIGYGCTSLVRDKDGISAALSFVLLTAALAASGTTVLGRLDELALEAGLHLTAQVSLRFASPADAVAVVGRVRAAPPGELGGRAVVTTIDHLHGEHGLPPSDLLIFHLDGGARVLLRPSGTEPKLKAYLEVVEPVASTAELPAARDHARAALAALDTDMRTLLA